MVLRGRCCVDALEDSPKPVEGIDAVGVADGEEAAKGGSHGDVHGGDMGICQEQVLASDSHKHDNVLYQVIGRGLDRPSGASWQGETNSRWIVLPFSS